MTRTRAALSGLIVGAVSVSDQVASWALLILAGIACAFFLYKLDQIEGELSNEPK